MCAESVGEIFAFQLRGEVQGKKQVCVSSTAWADQTPPGAWQTLGIPYKKRFYAFTAPVRGGKVPVALQSRLGGKEKRTAARSLTEQVSWPGVQVFFLRTLAKRLMTASCV